MNRIPALEAYQYDIEHASRKIASHCVEKLRNDKRPDREANANATLHAAVLAEMLAFKSQLDAAIVSAFQFGLDRLKK